MGSERGHLPPWSILVIDIVFTILIFRDTIGDIKKLIEY